MQVMSWYLSFSVRLRLVWKCLVHPCCCTWHYLIPYWVVFHGIRVPRLHSSVCGHSVCFYALVIVNSAAVNIGVNVSFQIRIFSRYMTMSGIPGLYGNSSFSFFKEKTALHRDCTSLHSHQQCRRVPSSPDLLQHWLFTDLVGHPDQCEMISHCSFD